MASDWMLNRVQGTSTPTTPVAPTPSTPMAQPKPMTPPVTKPSYVQNLVSSNVNTLKTANDFNQKLAGSVVTAPQRMATAGLGYLGKALNAPQQFIQDKITGGKGYEDFYSNQPVGKAIIKVANNPVAKVVLPPAGAFQTPKRAAFASSIALDPLNLVGAGLLEKGTTTGKILLKTGEAMKLPEIATKIGSAVSKIPGLQKARDAIGAFQYGYGMPEKTLKQYETLQTNLSKSGEFASKVAGPLKYDAAGKELPKEVQSLLGYVKNLLETNPGRDLRPDEQAAVKAAEPIVQKLFDDFQKLAQGQIKAGVNPETFSKMEGAYGGKRMFEKTFTTPKAGAGGVKLDITPYMNRKNLSAVTREKMGEIMQPAYGAAKSAFAEKNNLEIMKFFKGVAKDQAVSEQGYQALDKAGQEALSLIPKDPKYGVLAGSYVPKGVANYITPLVDSKLTGIEKLAEPFTKVWKPMKTVLSPSQLGRNVITSQVQSFLENPEALLRGPQAIKEAATKGKFYQALKGTGELMGNSPASELQKFMPPELSKLSNNPGNLLSRAFEAIKKPGSAIQATNETIAKLQNFIARLSSEAGKARITIDEALQNPNLVEIARKSAESSAFNYTKVSPLVSRLRKSAVPFITYPLKAAELTGKTLLHHPERLTALMKGEKALKDITSTTTPNEKYLPSYLNQATQVGNPNDKGTTPYLNTKYVYPWGNMTDIVAGEGQFNPFTNIGIAPNPLMTEAYSQMFSKDIFGNDIKGTGAHIRHAAETLGPSFVRTAGQLYDVATKNPSSSTSPTIGSTLIKGVGIPYYKYNPTESARWDSYSKSQKVTQLQSDRRKFIRDYSGKISPEKMNNQMMEFNKQIQDVLSQ